MLKQTYQDEEGFPIRLEARLKNARLVRAREQLGLTIKQFSEMIGISYPICQFYESMRCYPSRERQEKICQFYRDRGIFLFEEDVFPEELRSFVPKRKYVAERSVPKPQLISLNQASQNLLPYTTKQEEYDRINEGLMKESVAEVLSTLSDREAYVIKRKFGIIEKPATAEEIGRELHVSDGRILQIEAKALRKLRHPTRARILRKYLSTMQV